MIFYVARHSHTLYLRKGIQWRLFALANDRTSRGHLWAPQVVIVRHDALNPPALSWAHYRGRYAAAAPCAGRAQPRTGCLTARPCVDPAQAAPGRPAYANVPPDLH